VKGFKTILFGVLVAAISVLSNPEMQAFVAEHLPEVGGMIGTAIVVLRAVTTSAIFKKDEPKDPPV